MDDLVEAINVVWDNPELAYKIRSTNDYRRYFKETYGWDDISTELFDNAWDLASSDVEDGVKIGSTYYTLEDAVDWLEDKLSEYGNTRFFPSEDTDILDKLISKFGNPYFWRD